MLNPIALSHPWYLSPHSTPYEHPYSIPDERPGNPNPITQIKRGFTPEYLSKLVKKFNGILKDLTQESADVAKKSIEMAKSVIHPLDKEPLVRINISPGFLALSKDKHHPERGWRARGIVEGMILNDRPLSKLDNFVGAISFTNVFPLIRRTFGPWYFEEAKEKRNIWRERSAYMMARPYPKLLKDKAFDICIGARAHKGMSSLFIKPEIQFLEGSGWEKKGYFRAEVQFSMKEFIPLEPEKMRAFAVPKGVKCRDASARLYIGLNPQKAHKNPDLVIPHIDPRFAGKSILSVPGSMTPAIDSPDNTIIISDIDDTVLNSKMLQTFQMIVTQFFRKREAFSGASLAFRMMGERGKEALRKILKTQEADLDKIWDRLDAEKKKDIKEGRSHYPYTLPKTSQQFVSAGSILMLPVINELLQSEKFDVGALHMNPLFMSSVWTDIVDLHRAAHPFEYKDSWFRSIQRYFPKSRKILVEDSAQVGPEVLAKSYKAAYERHAHINGIEDTEENGINWRLLIHLPWPMNEGGKYIRYNDMTSRQKAKLDIERINKIMRKHGVPDGHYYLFADWYEHVVLQGIGLLPDSTSSSRSTGDFSKGFTPRWTSTAEFIKEREGTYGKLDLLAPPPTTSKERIDLTLRQMGQSCMDQSLHMVSSFSRLYMRTKRFLKSPRSSRPPSPNSDSMRSSYLGSSIESSDNQGDEALLLDTEEDHMICHLPVGIQDDEKAMEKVVSSPKMKDYWELLMEKVVRRFKYVPEDLKKHFSSH